METLLYILILLFLFLISQSIKSKHENLNNKIKGLQDGIKSLHEKLAKQDPTKVNKEVILKEEIRPELKISRPLLNEEKKEISAKNIENKEPLSINKEALEAAQKEKKETKKIEQKLIPKAIPEKSIWEKFKEKNPDLEKFIGENLINKIGILILVLGISFFVKFAIDKEWINEPARVGIGILCGSLVMLIAHKLKRNYASFSSVLVAGAICIYYFTIYFAFHQYQLFSQTTAFIIMVIITAFSTLVSVSYNRQELAVLSLIGGFAVPFMLSTGEGNYLVLFTYIAILNVGILAISYFKKWKIATVLAFAFTTLLYGGWLAKSIGEPSFSHSGALIFATLFYFIFSITIVLNNLRNKGEFSTIEYFILVINTFFFFGVGMLILNHWESNFTGLFTLFLAIYNVSYATILYKRFGLDKNAIYLLIGLALTFVTLTIPIQFSGNQITLFWAAEAVLLLWLSQKSKIKSFKLGAIVVQGLAVISLLIDWDRYIAGEDLTVIINPLFITGIVVSISLFVTHWLLRKDEDLITKYVTINSSIHRLTVLIAAIIITYFTGILETGYQSFQFLANKASATSLPVTYHFVFVAVALYLSSLSKKTIILQGLFIVSAISVLLYIVRLYVLPSLEISENYIYNTSTKNAFYLHYIILGCLVYFGLLFYKKTNSLFDVKISQYKWLPWIGVFAIVYILSNEVMIHSLQFINSVDTSELVEGNVYENRYLVKQQLYSVKQQIIKIGYPILWGIFSFIFLIIGIRKQWKILRIIALSLLGLTIVKLFVYDIQNVSETGKIIAFILLGVLILIISFVYQKIRKLVVDDATENQNEDE